MGYLGGKSLEEALHRGEMRVRREELSEQIGEIARVMGIDFDTALQIGRRSESSDPDEVNSQLSRLAMEFDRTKING